LSEKSVRERKMSTKNPEKNNECEAYSKIMKILLEIKVPPQYISPDDIKNFSKKYIDKDLPKEEEIKKEIYIHIIKRFCDELKLPKDNCNLSNIDLNELEKLVNTIHNVEESKSLLKDEMGSLCILFNREHVCYIAINYFKPFCLNNINNINIGVELELSETSFNNIFNNIYNKVEKTLLNGNKNKVEKIKEIIKNKIYGNVIDCIRKNEKCTLQPIVSDSIDSGTIRISIKIYSCVFIGKSYHMFLPEITSKEINSEVNKGVLQIKFNGYTFIEWNYG
ncbi:MAG: hypothetical protein QXZ41_08255, partial [Ignisphaera sp.]